MTAAKILLPITDNDSLARATAALRALDREMTESGLDPHPLDDLADMVMHRIMAYEQQHFPIPDTDGASTLAFLMEQRQVTQQQVADATGIQQTTISQLLRRKRNITADHARKLGEFFNVTAGSFL